jgi:hypothetical protein
MIHAIFGVSPSLPESGYMALPTRPLFITLVWP